MADKLTLLLSLCAVSSLFISPHMRNVPGSQVWSLVQASDYLSVVITYTDENELCKKLEPYILTVAESYKHLIRFYAVECHTVVEYECTPEMEKSLPGLLLAHPSSTNSTTGEVQLFKERYTGQMNMKTFGQYLLSKMPFYGYTLTFATMPAFVKAAAFNKTVLFTDKDSVPSMFKALSAQFRDRMQFGVVWKNQTEVANKYNVKFFPTILTFSRGKTFEYDGEIAFEDLKWYYGLYASLEKALFLPSTAPEFAADSAKAVNASAHSRALKQGKSLAISLFYTSEKPSEDWERLRTDFKGMAQFLEMNCTSSSELEQAELLGITVFPSYLLHPVNRALAPLSLFPSNASNLMQTQYRSEVMSMDDMKAEHFHSLLKNVGKLVTVLVAESIPLAFHAIASDIYFKSFSVFMVYTRDTQQLPGGFPISRRPGVLTLTAAGESVHIQEYAGQLEDYTQLKYHFEEVLAGLYHTTRNTEEDWTEETIEELTQKLFSKSCSKKTPYCLIGLLNGSQETSPSTIELLKKAKAYSERTNKPFRFAWVDGRCEFEFLRSIPLYDTQLPAFLIYQGHWNRTLPLVDEMDEVQLRLQIDKVAAGKFASEETATLSLTDRNCKEVDSFYEAVGRVTNQHRKQEIIDSFHRTEEYKVLNNDYSKRTGQKADL